MTATLPRPGPHGASVAVRRAPAGTIALRTGPALVLVLMLGLGALLLTPTRYASAAEDPQQVSINFSSMDPALPDRNATITLTGSITNTSGEPLSGVQAIFWRDQSPITDPESLSSALSSGATQPWGSRVFDKAGAFSNLTSETRPTIGPGETAPFRVQAKVADLELPRTAGAYLIGVHVLGRAGRKGNATLGRGRLLVPVPSGVSAPTATGPVPTSTVVLLSSRPAMISPGRFTDDHLAAELAGGGRLQVLMQAAQRDDVSYAIDPALLESLTAMANGYEVLDPDNRTVPGAGQQLAQGWLKDFAELDVLNGFRTPFANPDLNSLAHQGLTAAVPRVKAATDRIEQVKQLPVLVAGSDGQLSADTIDLVEQFGPRVILASNARTSQTALQPLRTAPVVSYDPQLFAGGPGPDPRTTSVHQRQRLLAESFVTSLGSQRRTSVRVVSTADEAIADMASDAPWVRRTTLGQVLEGQAQEWSKELAPLDPGSEFSPAAADSLRTLDVAYANYADLLVDPAGLHERADAAMARSSSSWWRRDPQGQDGYVRPQLREARNLTNGGAVTMNVQGSVIMSGQSGSFPMTLTNQLSQPVHVDIHFESDQPQRLSIPTREQVVIGARESVTVNIQPRAAGNGPVRVQTWLTTPNGTVLGRRTALRVEATNLGFVGWIIVFASGIVLLGATTLRIRQVRRERQQQTSQARRAYAAEPGDHPTPPVVQIDPPDDRVSEQTASHSGTEEGHERG